MKATTARAPVLRPGSFYGAAGDAWRSSLVKLTLLRHDAPRRVPPHSHEHMFLSLLLEGGYREWVGERRIDYGPLTAVFHPEGLEHHDEILAPGTLFFVVEAAPALLAARERRHRALASICDLSGGPIVWSLLRLLDDLRGHRRDDLDLEEPVAEILDALLGGPALGGARPRWLGRVEERLTDDFRSSVTLPELADLAGVHPVHLARVFRRHVGCTMRTFVHRLRVLHACREIAGGRGPLAAVAADSGFCDQSHMTHVFRQITGVTPTAYRRIVSGRG